MCINYYFYLCFLLLSILFITYYLLLYPDFVFFKVLLRLSVSEMTEVSQNCKP